MLIKRLENLDALQFLCFLAVFSVHSIASRNESSTSDTNYILLRKYFINSGSLGVNFFCAKWIFNNFSVDS